MTSTVRFSKVRQLLVDFQLIPLLSLDSQVALNIGKTAPLTALIQSELERERGRYCRKQ